MQEKNETIGTEVSLEKPFVMVTTQWRGVFAGYLEADKGAVVELSNVRSAIRWNTQGGFLELAEVGPNSDSRIGSTAPWAKLQGVTGVWRCTEAARGLWLSHGQ